MAPLRLSLIATATFTAQTSGLAFNKGMLISSITDDEWNALNASVSGNLRNGEPITAPCYARYNGELQTADQCTWGIYQATGEASTLGTLRPDILTPILDPCESVGDVQKTLKFAGDNKLRLVVKNTGHDYRGGARRQTHWLRGFHSHGCEESTGPAITFGAGQQFGGINDFVEENGYRVIGGSSLTMGAAGGWITGGGHSLGVDNVQQLKAVLPKDDYITANRCQNQDLFFALRGGGGGTFAVLTEMTTRVHPKKEMQFVQMTFTTLGPIAQSKLMDVLIDSGLRWAVERWGAGTSVSLLSHEEADALMKPLAKFAATLNLGLVQVKSTDDYRERIHAFTDIINLGYAPGSAWALSSRIIKRDTFSNKTNASLVSSLTDILNEPPDLLGPSSRILSICLKMASVYSKNLPDSDRPGEPGLASIAPRWRDGAWQALHFRAYDGTITNPDIADLWEPDYVGSFCGEENYERLLGIKRTVDPDNLLMGDGRFECYPDVDES
ncbi:FAD-binding oxidoreductase [Aspergillus undulatus]|uniref:FAD-binding oxidoreductase n=1 Tax=Aspergillus undulatus TaxID=1810928 RepID=UPI003CCCD0D0